MQWNVHVCNILITNYQLKIHELVFTELPLFWPDVLPINHSTELRETF